MHMPGDPDVEDEPVDDGEFLFCRETRCSLGVSRVRRQPREVGERRLQVRGHPPWCSNRLASIQHRTNSHGHTSPSAAAFAAAVVWSIDWLSESAGDGTRTL